MLLADWDITLKLAPIEPGDDGEDPPKADCDAKPEYKEAVVRMDLRRIPDDQIDAYCVHELTHVVNWPVEQLAEQSARDANGYETARFICETVATTWQDILLNVRTAR